MNTRINELIEMTTERRLDEILVFNEANIRALTGITCDSACLDLRLNARGKWSIRFLTDFRYAPMVHRVAPDMRVGELKSFKIRGHRIGYEIDIPHSDYLDLRKSSDKARFIDITDYIKAIRAAKTPDEQKRIRAAVALNDQIWRDASAQFRAGQSEREMANIIRHMMIERGDGEAFSTIVSIGANAAECHHEPDDTVWNGREGILVDMGVKLNGVCSDMTRNIKPLRQRPIYRQIYDLVLKANLAAIAAAKPGMTCKALDRVARNVIRKGGFGKCFGHSLGHGVGYEIHEAPAVSKRDDTVLKPGMTVTIEPGVYLEGNLGVRIEDLVLITETGCEVLSASEK